MLRISHGSLCLRRRFNVGKRWIFNLQGEAVLLILRVSREFELLRFLRLLASVESREWVLWCVTWSRDLINWRSKHITWLNPILSKAIADEVVFDRNAAV
ncbi:hypothetical protein GBA52_004016 [Prunus armeniaca]|nr:hypothetical protein GBA52_004016 [Prunus armeniaca]